DDPGEGFGIPLLFVRPGLVVQPVARPRSVQGVDQRLRLERLAALKAGGAALGEGAAAGQSLPVLADDHVQMPLPGEPVAVLDHTSELQSRENLVCRLLLEK